jgi:3-oxoacyl-[acyl-carrier protein] reductase
MFDLTGNRACNGRFWRNWWCDSYGAGRARRALRFRHAVEALEKVKAELGGDHVITPCNLSDPAAVDALVGQAEAALGGKLDILVANAGITKDGLLLRMKDEDFQKVLAINLEGYFRLSRAALKTMMKNRWGRIIGITSVVGVTGNPGQECGVKSRHDRLHQSDGC